MLMQPVRAPALERAGIWPFAAAWLLASAIMLIAGWHGITHLEFPDPDDSLRLQQVRDWIGGQSWFDVTQYRLNPPDGAPMHWSRLVDVPIAAVILALQPLLGNANAELAALIVVPLMTLGVVMILVAKLTERLLDRQHAILATLLVPVSIAATAQMRPLRIDHHGWQIALCIGAALAALDGNRRRSGLVAGALASLWLQISLEGLPFAAALAALFGLRWLIDSNERERLLGFIVALAVGSIALFGVTKSPAVWALTYCDSVSAGHLVALTVGAVGTFVLVGAKLPSLPAKLAGCAVLGAAVVASLLIVAPQCAAGPFEALDPLVRRFWYERVLEGMPIWRQSFAIAAIVIAFPIVGLAGTWRAFREAKGVRQTNWAVTLFLLGAAMVAAVLVQRGGAVANMLALPGGVYLFEKALARARVIQSMPVRLVATLAALALVTPAYAVSGIATIVAEREGTKFEVVRDCVTRKQIGKLDALPPGIIAAPLDITPAIIVYTGQRAIASGHHRNAAAMRDVIQIFTLPPEQARRLLDRRGANYIAVCPTLIEPALFKDQGPNGLWAQLDSGRTPSWLEPVRFDKSMNLRVWRIKPGI